MTHDIGREEWPKYELLLLNVIMTYLCLFAFHFSTLQLTYIAKNAMPLQG